MTDFNSIWGKDGFSDSNEKFFTRISSPFSKALSILKLSEPGFTSGATTRSCISAMNLSGCFRKIRPLRWMNCRGLPVLAQKMANSLLGTSTPSSRHFIEVSTCNLPEAKSLKTLSLSLCPETNFLTVINLSNFITASV